MEYSEADKSASGSTGGEKPGRTSGLQSPRVARIALVVAAIVLFHICSQLTMVLRRDKESPPQFKQVSGRLKTYSFDKSYKESRTTVFDIDGSPERFWTTALSYKEVSSLWKPGSTQLSFFVQTNRTYSTVKTFGMVVDGREVQSLKDNIAEGAIDIMWLGALRFVTLGLAVATLLYAFFGRFDKPGKTTSTSR